MRAIGLELERVYKENVKKPETGFLVVPLHISFPSQKNPVSYRLPVLATSPSPPLLLARAPTRGAPTASCRQYNGNSEFINSGTQLLEVPHRALFQARQHKLCRRARWFQSPLYPINPRHQLQDRGGAEVCYLRN
jgi:hypothetical protein